MIKFATLVMVVVIASNMITITPAMYMWLGFAVFIDFTYWILR